MGKLGAGVTKTPDSGTKMDKSSPNHGERDPVTKPPIPVRETEDAYSILQDTPVGRPSSKNTMNK